MLPRPATFSVSTHSSYRLFGRARVTNLGLYILLGALLLSLAANWRQWLAHRPHPIPYNQLLLDSSLQPLRNISNLIVVAGHAIFQGCQPSQWNLEDQWVLQDHQKGTNSPEAFYSHITKGVHLLRADPSAILIFSGGVTRLDHPIQSEAQSYLKLAIANNLFDATNANNRDQLQLRSRAFTEDYALDSFQNLLFSIARFHELALASGISTASPSAWPAKITVVGFEMKKRRFVELHRRALLFPEDRFEYVGVDFITPEAKERGWEGENKFGYQPYSKDLYGCHGELAAKRKTRNPYARFHPYHMTNPELAPLLDWCPPNWGSPISAQVYPRSLPWS